MSELRERLDDLLDATPSYVVADAGAAWRAGALRRRRRQVGAGVLVVVLVLLAGLGLGALPRPGTVDPAEHRGGGVDGYPTRIADPWRISDLPDAPGPLAGILVNGFDEGDRFGVTPDGRLLRIPEGHSTGGFLPFLSDDGRHLAYLEDGSTFVVQDLVDGTRRQVEGLGDNRALSPEAYRTSGQTSGFWSPDGDRLLIWGTPSAAGKGGRFLLVDEDASFVVFPDLPGGGGFPVGWLSSNRLAWLVDDEERRTIELLVTDDRAREQSRVRLDVTGAEVDGLDQWTGSLSPDGSAVRLVLDGTSIVFDTVSGARTWSGDLASPWNCATSWQDGEPLGAAADGLGDRDGRAVVATELTLGSVCLSMAADALAGEPHRGLGGLVFGTRTGWLSWHWREAGLGVVGGLLALAGILVVRRRRVSGSAAPGSA